MSGGLFNIAVSGLNTAQRALDTTGHNIANINTEGYSRQRAEVATRPAQFSGAGYIGTGVQGTTIRRMYDEFIQTQLRNTTSTSRYYDTLHESLSRVDNLVADPSAGLAPALQGFFSAVQGVANDPTSSANRTVLLSEAESLVDRFNFLHQRFQDQQSIVDGQIGDSVQEINSITDALARLNAQIVSAQGRGQPPNDLLDKRDQLILELSGYVEVATVEQDDGAMNVFIGRGQGVVLGDRATPLNAVSSTPGMPLEIRLGTGDKTVDITRQMTGGQLGGLLEIRNNVLDVAHNELGRVAVGMALAFNSQHEQGFDLQGTPGTAFFTVPEPEVLPGKNTPAPNPVVAFDPAALSDLKASDYLLVAEGADWKLTRLSDGQVLGTFGASSQILQDGLIIDTPPPGADGNQFLIRPTRNASADIAVAIKDPEKIAAAGNPTDGIGDNRNALELAKVQTTNFLNGGTASLEGAYDGLVGRIGTKTREAEVASLAQGRLLADAKAQRESVSGVNLDEEAANLLRYQQAYQASAQIIAISNTLFDTLIGVVRR
ncbi:flagellar hook-associated protein FlgK [Ectothiorhodospira lacustris]|uniref:flagellar hook-associated protein FlgK n=1 Tax=Ectothiorhodospira lacustris TaxID=2899127 RepID=UPI001EE7BF27|nr:flagellar hook-associated protein FlgK [Ectothiorhodospira lacustris]MCG5511039.1 flagellar hook-associated protein FlgK [Ectothiorhodospira lacustris]MCG5522769.1 flagellar hook-associated protein FlgK [Ectothiorhodospira lacustris]